MNGVWYLLCEQYPLPEEPVLVRVLGLGAPEIRIATFHKKDAANVFWHGIVMGYGAGVTHWTEIPEFPPISHETLAKQIQGAKMTWKEIERQSMIPSPLTPPLDHDSFTCTRNNCPACWQESHIEGIR